MLSSVLMLLSITPFFLGIILSYFLPNESFLIVKIEDSPDQMIAKVVSSFDNFKTSDKEHIFGSYSESCNDVQSKIYLKDISATK